MLPSTVISSDSYNPSTNDSQKPKRRPKLKLGLEVSNLTPRSGGMGAEFTGQDLTTSIQELSLSQEPYPTMRMDEIVKLSEQEEGVGLVNGGLITVVKHVPTDRIIIKELVRLSPRASHRSSLQRELHWLSKCNSPYILSFYGASFDTVSQDMFVFAEYMDCGSLETINHYVELVPENIIGQICYAVLSGVRYLYESAKLLHTNLQPDNVLFNSNGEIKLANFGSSGYDAMPERKFQIITTENLKYQPPERILGAKFRPSALSWSIGMILLETALGRFPFPSEGQTDNKLIGIFNLLEYIVNEPLPKLPVGKYSAEFEQFLEKCLMKNVERSFQNENVVVRPDFTELITESFALRAEQNVGKVDMQGFVRDVLEKRTQKVYA